MLRQVTFVAIAIVVGVSTAVPAAHAVLMDAPPQWCHKAGRC
jgi:hypothetical protein